MDVYRKFKNDLFICIIICWALMVVFGAFERDSTDGEKRSGMALKIDAMTGCHYLEGQRGGLIQRFDSNGKQICSH
ncbi:MAG: hypothetical protein KAV87_24075 [Desulfobacteraceae bacterium]|nr:hypothetical protein [Desulfobacteraceae bacterium]